MKKKDYKKPNFFIVGAPKAGTTALSEYLAEHPDIFFSIYKEPNFFNKDYPQFSEDIDSEKFNKFIEKEYLKKYFKGSKGYEIVAEGSINYLYSRIAIPRIIKFNPQALFLVMIRNPVEMAPSLHSQAVLEGYEDVEDFATAWELQEARKKGEKIPKSCKNPNVLQYGERCKLGEQIEYLFKVVPKSEVKIGVYDDFKDNPKEVYEETLCFLGISSDGREEFPIVNPSKKVKHKSVNRLINKITKSEGLKKGLIGTKRMLGIDKLGVLDKLSGFYVESRKRKPISSEMRKKLINYFKDDVDKLSNLTGRDLSHWMN